MAQRLGAVSGAMIDAADRAWTKREKNRPYEKRATEHTAKTGHAAFGDKTGWTCLENGCGASAGDMRAPQPDDGGGSYYDDFVDGRGF